MNGFTLQLSHLGETFRLKKIIKTTTKVWQAARRCHIGVLCLFFNVKCSRTSATSVLGITICSAHIIFYSCLKFQYRRDFFTLSMQSSLNYRNASYGTYMGI